MSAGARRNGVHGDAALIPAILAFVALLVVFDYVANDGDIVREVLVWLIRTGRNVAGVIHQLVMSFFGE